MQGISYGDDKREKKAERAKWWCVRQPRAYQRQEAVPTPGLEDLWEEVPLPEGPPSRAEPRSPAAVRAGTTEHMSTL